MKHNTNDHEQNTVKGGRPVEQNRVAGGRPVGYLTRMTEVLNQAQTQNNTSKWLERDLNPGHRIEIQRPKPLSHPAS